MSVVALESPPTRGGRRLLALDLALTAAAFVLAVGLHGGFAAAWRGALPGLAVFLVIARIAFAAFGVQRGLPRHASSADLYAIVRAASLAVGAFLLLRAPLGLYAVPAAAPVSAWFVLIVLLGGARLGVGVVRGRREAAADAPAEPVLLAGTAEEAAFVLKLIETTPGAVRVVGVLDTSGAAVGGRLIRRVPVLGPLADAERIARRLHVHGLFPRRLILASPVGEVAPGVLDMARVASERVGMAFVAADLPPLGRRPAASPPAPASAGSSWLAGGTRRAGEAALAFALLAAFLPLMLPIALGVALDVGRPVLFRQQRPGRRLRPFVILKFRTMRPAVTPDGRVLADRERLSAFGRLLRRTRLDELPQLVNVLRGDMAFVGPRPLLPRDQPADGAGRAAVRPGVTGWAQVNGGETLTPAEKLAFDLWYVERAGPWLDLRIVARTLAVALGRGTARPKTEPAPAPRRRIGRFDGWATG